MKNRANIDKIMSNIGKLSLFIVFMFSFYLLYAQDEPSQQESIQQEPADLEAELEKLKADYERVVRDRDNILAQTKNLLKYKVELRKMEDEVKRMENKNEKAEAEKQALLKQIGDFKDHIDDLQGEKGELKDQIENLKNYIEKKEIEYKIIDETKRQLAEANKDKEKLKREILNLEEKTRKLEAEKLAFEADGELYRRQYVELRDRYQEALSVNKRLERKLSEVPRKFAEIARENKLLLKETALMHYNLGVFYTEEGQHKRAVAEFEKSIDLNPEDAYAYFNLGYIYAEHLVNRSRAIQYFRKYLKLADKEDRDKDWVKKYILTWQTWEGKKPIK